METLVDSRTFTCMQIDGTQEHSLKRLQKLKCVCTNSIYGIMHSICLLTWIEMQQKCYYTQNRVVASIVDRFMNSKGLVSDLTMITFSLLLPLNRTELIFMRAFTHIILFTDGKYFW